MKKINNKEESKLMSKKILSTNKSKSLSKINFKINSTKIR